MIVNRVGQVVGGGRLFQVGHGKDHGAEEFLGFGSFLRGYSQMASELEIDDGQSRSHEEKVRKLAG